MRFLLFLPTLIAVSILQNSSPVVHKSQDSVVQFWTWFQLNEKKLRSFDTDPAQALEEIHQQLQKIAPGLAVETNANNSSNRVVTVTANGDEDLFPLVQEIVRKAPAIAGWQFIAFRQRASPQDAANLSIKSSSVELAVNNMKFFPVVENDSLDIIVYVKEINDDNYMEIAYYSLLLLDNLLGEYDCVKKVRSYDFHPLPGKKEDLADLQPLIALPAFVYSFSKKGR